MITVPRWQVLFVSLIFAMAAVSSSALMTLANAAADSEEDRIVLKVYNPTGAKKVTHLHAARLSKLEGGRICLLSDHLWESQRTFPLVRDLLEKRYPQADIVSHTELPNIYHIKAGDLKEAVRQKGCDAAVVGNAG
jgi:hypothetical protein